MMLCFDSPYGVHDMRIEGNPYSRMTYHVCNYCELRLERGPGLLYKPPVQTKPGKINRDLWR